jgi:hypothetical protein
MITTIIDISSLRKKREELVKKLIESPTWAAGSFRKTVTYNKGYPNKGHSHQFISRRVEGRYKSTYVRQSQMEQAQRAVEWRRQVNCIINQIAEINIEIIKSGGEL